MILILSLKKKDRARFSQLGLTKLSHAFWTTLDSYHDLGAEWSGFLRTIQARKSSFSLVDCFLLSSFVKNKDVQPSTNQAQAQRNCSLLLT